MSKTPIKKTASAKAKPKKTRKKAAPKDAIVLSDIHKSYVQGGKKLEILKGVNLSLKKGEMVALLGPSGSGKSTLLHAAGLLESMDSGTILFHGKECQDLSDSVRTSMRQQELGFVYQFHHLLPEFTALENLVLPQMIGGTKRRDAEIRGLELLDSLGLKERASHLPSKLSGGEQQRVAILRALVNEPSLLLADEPTGNLDQETSRVVFDELRKLVKKTKLSALIATHDRTLAERMDRIVVLKDGILEG
ncbi:MAG: ABC transporter ATP-binding protein [Alphaproteobacteria bacterium]